MRDPKRIDSILKLIKEIWEKNPDLRLGQLIGNCFSGDLSNLYYQEDDFLEKALKYTYKIKDRKSMLTKSRQVNRNGWVK